MIYSCSMFFNEFKLLDLKMAEQMDYIDKMIIVEAEKTHTNKKKEVLLYNNEKYNHPKLEKMLVPASEFTKSPAHNEGHQRNFAMLGREIKDDDIIISCDLDELLSAKDMEKVIDKIRELEYVRFGMQIYYYKINMRMGTWRSPIGLTGKFFKESRKSLTKLRHMRQGKVIKTFGKHFSYLSSPEDIRLKLDSFVHANMGKNISIDKINDSNKNS